MLTYILTRITSTKTRSITSKTKGGSVRTLKRTCGRAYQVFFLCHWSWETLPTKCTSWPCSPSSRVWGVPSRIYQEVWRAIVKPWIYKIADRRPYALHQPSTPPQKAKTNLAQLVKNIPQNCLPDLRPPSSSNCNPVHYFFCSVGVAKTNKHAYSTVNFLRAAITEGLAAVDKTWVARACDSLSSHLEMLVSPGGGYIET